MSATTRVFPLLLLLFAAAAGGCGVFAGASPTQTPTPTPTRTSTPTATPTATPTVTPTPKPQVQRATVIVAQGSATVLRVRGGGTSAVASFNGREYPLLAEPGGFWGVLGVAADQATGSYTLSVVLQDQAGGALAQLNASLAVLATAYPVEQISLAPGESALLDPALAVQEEAARSRVFATFTPERLWSGPFHLPVAGSISSPYGIGRSYNGGPVTSFHHGTDFPVTEGTPVVAANAGRVAFVGTLPIRGVSVIVDHGAGVFSAYHHLSRSAVQEGQTVATGDLVGYSGASGLATGPHLHWEIIVGGVNVDPVLWTTSEIGP